MMTESTSEPVNETLPSIESQFRNPTSALARAIGMEIAQAQAELTLQLRKEKYAGFKVRAEGQPELIRDTDGDFDARDVMRFTGYECPHCAGWWPDDGQQGVTRRWLDEHVEYRVTRPNALPGHVGFTAPVWINPRISFGSVMLKFRKAMAGKAVGNLTELEEFRTAWEAEDWNLAKETSGGGRELTQSSYETDPAKLMPNSHCRQMTVDCHKALDAGPDEQRIGAFWFECREFDKRGNSIQLARGFVDSWELVAAQQRHWKIPASRVFVDCAWMPSQVEEAATRFFELVKFGAVLTPSTWKMAAGSGADRRLTVGGKNANYQINQLPKMRSAHDKTGRHWNVTLRKLMWANMFFEQQLDSIRSGALSVKWGVLSREQLVVVDVDGKPSVELLAKTLARERDNGTYENQMDSRYYDEKQRKYMDHDKRAWVGDKNSGRPTEYRDCGLMHLAGVAKDGLLGHVATQD